MVALQFRMPPTKTLQYLITSYRPHYACPLVSLSLQSLFVPLPLIQSCYPPTWLGSRLLTSGTAKKNSEVPRTLIDCAVCQNTKASRTYKYGMWATGLMFPQFHYLHVCHNCCSNGIQKVSIHRIIHETRKSKAC